MIAKLIYERDGKMTGLYQASAKHAGNEGA